MVALEFGSDLFGSLRVPAHFCGLFGHKPSVGVLPTRGHDFPGTHQEPGDKPAVVGPLARCADDLDRVLDAIAGPDQPDAAAYRLALPAPRHAALRGWRVLVLAEHPAAACSSDMRIAVEGVAERLARAGATVARASPLLPDLEDVSSTYTTLVTTFLGAFEPGGSTTLSAHDWVRLIIKRDAVRVQWRAFFQQFDAVVCPPFGCAAFRTMRSPISTAAPS